MTRINQGNGLLATVSSVGLAMFGIAIPQPADASRRHVPGSTLSLSGAPATTVQAGTAYTFTPTARSTSARLSFSISNKPAWATFSIASGKLSGTPANAQTGNYPGILISVSDGRSAANLAPFDILVTAIARNTPANTAPVISGTPAAAVMAGTAYAFQPVASDANGDTLNFAVSGKPAWAAFSPTTGRLAGTPDASYVGTYSNIVISVSDGKTSTALPAFAITVNGSASGAASLAWTPPTQNTDGSSLTNVAGYAIYYGATATSLTTKVVVTNAGASAYTLGNLASGTYYFAITAFTTTGAESALSNLASKTIL